MAKNQEASHHPLPPPSPEPLTWDAEKKAERLIISPVIPGSWSSTHKGMMQFSCKVNVSAIKEREKGWLARCHYFWPHHHWIWLQCDFKPLSYVWTLTLKLSWTCSGCQIFDIGVWPLNWTQITLHQLCLQFTWPTMCLACSRTHNLSLQTWAVNNNVFGRSLIHMFSIIWKWLGST